MSKKKTADIIYLQDFFVCQQPIVEKPTICNYITADYSTENVPLYDLTVDREMERLDLAQEYHALKHQLKIVLEQDQINRQQKEEILRNFEILNARAVDLSFDDGGFDESA